ncbi:hypothetical protein OAB29_06685 [Oceanospirillaceae bacterium]|nr:hypothetical protein [Oceanospirillaceae bacterium]MDC1341785.1 hypothetical protein [Oceanospirillaceae bacterium]
MSLYYTQKILYDLNRDTNIQHRYKNDLDDLLGNYTLTDEEVTALTKPDIGLLYVLGVNGQILMHFAAFHQIEWDDYLQAMRDGIEKYGPVREGVYAMTGSGRSFTEDTEVKL